MSVERETWSPRWATHVVGVYDVRAYDEDGVPEPQKVEAKCGLCGADWRTTCRSGAVRQHISTFAALHTHPERNRPTPVRR